MVALPRCDFSVMRGWQQMTNAIRWIKQFAEKIMAKFVTPICSRQHVDRLTIDKCKKAGNAEDGSGLCMRYNIFTQLHSGRVAVQSQTLLAALIPAETTTSQCNKTN